MDGGRVNILGVIYQLVASGSELVEFNYSGDGEGAEFDGFVYPEYADADNAVITSSGSVLQQMKCSGASSAEKFDREAFIEVIQSASRAIRSFPTSLEPITRYELVTNKPAGVIGQFLEHRRSNEEGEAWISLPVPDFLKSRTDKTEEQDEKSPASRRTLQQWLRSIITPGESFDDRINAALRFLRLLEFELVTYSDARERLLSWLQTYGIESEEADKHVGVLIWDLIKLASEGGGRISRGTLVKGVTGRAEGLALTREALSNPIVRRVNEWSASDTDASGGIIPDQYFIEEFWRSQLDEVLKAEVHLDDRPAFTDIDEDYPKSYASWLFYAQGGKGKTSGLRYVAKGLLAQGAIVLPIEITSPTGSEILTVLDEEIRTLAGWTSGQSMLDRLFIANGAQPIYVFIDRLNERAGTTKGIEYAKTIERLPLSRSNLRVVMAMRSDDEGNGPSARELPNTRLVAVEPISHSSALRALGIGASTGLNLRGSIEDEIIVDWPALTEPLLFGVLVARPAEEYRAAVRSDGIERAKVMFALAERVCERARAKAQIATPLPQVRKLLSALIQTASANYDGTTWSLLTDTAYAKARAHAVRPDFIEELVSVGFMYVDGEHTIFTYSNDFNLLQDWAAAVNK